MGALVAAIFLAPQRSPVSLVVSAATWLAACFLAEILWHRTLDGSTVVTMAPAAHLATLAVLPPAWALGVIFLSASAGAMTWRRWKAGPALRYAGAALAGGGAAVAVLVFSGVTAVLHAPGEGVVPVMRRPEYMVWLLASGLVYHLVVQAGVSWESGRRRSVSPWVAWKDAFGYQTEIVSSMALIVVGVLALFCFDVLGHRGLLLSVMPVLFVRDGSRRYIELAMAQKKLIENERLAAKGEMAAEIGHELNNYLAAISGRAQLLLRKLGKDTEESALAEEAARIREISTRMAELAKGLMGFSRREEAAAAYGLNDLVKKTVDFVRPQLQFRRVRFDIHPQDNLPGVEMDAGEVQQVLLTLLGRATRGNNGEEAEPSIAISTFLDARRKSVGIEIRLPAKAEDAREAEDGMESELGLVHRILERHHGRLETVEGSPGEEAYRVFLPAA